jgi:transcriptional regulator with XRE-family HTH domain
LVTGLSCVTEELLEGDMAKATIGDRALGMRLRHYRERAGVSLEYVAEVVDWSASKLSRFERGLNAEVTAEDVSAMLGVLRVRGNERAETMKLLTCKSGAGVWEVIDPKLSGESGIYHTFESSATRLTFVQPFIVPGLLQTSDYCRIVFQMFGVDETNVLRRMARRLGRQQLLARHNPPEITFVVNEHTLRQPVGSQLLMAQQVRRIIAEVARPHVSVRVVPESVVVHPAQLGGFVVLEFEDEPAIVYIEGRMSDMFPEDSDVVAAYMLDAEKQTELALDDECSLELLHTIAEDLERAR